MTLFFWRRRHDWLSIRAETLPENVSYEEPCASDPADKQAAQDRYLELERRVRFVELLADSYVTRKNTKR